MKKTFQTAIVLTFLWGLASPVLADNIFKGQPYFGLSTMLTAARDAQLDEGNGFPHPAFTANAEVVTQTGYGISLTGGWLLDSNWRMGLELSRRSVALDTITGPFATVSLDGEWNVHSAFINVAREFRGKAFVTPYVGLGLGVALHDLDLETVNGAAGPGQRTAVTPALQGLLGVLLEVGDDTDIVVGYRYVNYPSPDFQEFSHDFIDFHNFELGIRFYPEHW